MTREKEIRMIKESVNHFAHYMTDRMVQKLDEGLRGWDRDYPEKAIREELARDAITVLASASADKTVDIANRAMMLFVRSDCPEALKAFREDHTE